MQGIINRVVERVSRSSGFGEEHRRLGEYAQRWLLPPETDAKDYYVPSLRTGAPGVMLDVEAHARLLERWKADDYQELYRQLRADENLNCGLPGADFSKKDALHNGWYPTPDAEIYASMILDQKPDVMIEVGSGFSTHVARKAINYAGLSTQLHIIDPQPRTDVASAADGVEYMPVEASNLLKHAWTPQSILFIDSSHITRARGDVPFLFNQVVPPTSSRDAGART